jgi:predicted ribosome quality control (RQC) complex YloA/Tae2 family protein
MHIKKKVNMKRNQLVEVTKYLSQFKKISSINRVEDSIVKIVFNNRKALFFDMKKGDSHIFMKEEFKRAKVYTAPFDIILHKRFANSNIERFEVTKGNRILKIFTTANSSYKSQATILQFEFTGRNTNCIILDEQGVVLEALRHIDASVSYRTIKVGEILEELESREFHEPELDMGDDIESFLTQEYEKRSFIRLNALKNQKLINVQKKIDKFISLIDALESEEELELHAQKLNNWGALVLSNLHQIKPYQKELEVFDFEGKKIKIDLPSSARTPSEAANILFANSKKLKKKAKSLYIERENLEQKMHFLIRMKNVIENVNDENELNIIVPKQKKTKKERNEQINYESFFMNGYKIMLGKNEKGNIELLKAAKKSDIWLHLKDIPSSHVIIRTDKQSIPQDVIDFAAKLCVEFSVTKKGTYLVDYTQRRNVKVIDGANVTYVEYKTLHFEE